MIYFILTSMTIEQTLHQIGLHKSDIIVYLFLLENGLSTPPQIARGTKIARTNCYNILEALKNKDLVEEQSVGKRKAYLASDPGALLRSWEKKKELVERALPDLRALYTTQKNKPKIRFYEGVDGIQEIYHQTLLAKKIHGIGSTDQLRSLMPEFFDKYLLELAQHSIVFRDLLSDVSRKIVGPQMKKALGDLYDMRYFPSGQKDFQTDMLIWDDHVALITFDEPIFGTVLTHATLVQTFLILFETMWQDRPPSSIIEH